MTGWIIITTIDTNGSWRSCHRTSIMSTLQQESIHWRELFAARKTNIYSLKQIYKNVLDKGYNLKRLKAFKFLEPAELQEIVEAISMTRLGQMLVDKGMQEGMREGMKEGREEEKLSNARNLIDLLDAETIAERIGLPLETVQRIKRESNQ